MLDAAFDGSSTLACLALFGASFVQEGAALAAGALMVLGDSAPAPWVALSLYLGIVSGDCCVYGLGALARQSEWARRWIAGIDLERTKAWMEKRLPLAVATSHLVPWVLFPTFVTFGWFAVPFRRFAATSAVFNAVYIPAALLVLTTVGRAFWAFLNANIWSLWLVVGAAVATVTALRLRRARRS